MDWCVVFEDIEEIVNFFLIVSLGFALSFDQMLTSCLDAANVPKSNQILSYDMFYVIRQTS